jgi:hypothetical protein
MYLPTCVNEYLDKIVSADEVFHKIIEKIVQSKGLPRKKSNPVLKRNFMIDLASTIEENSVLELNESQFDIDYSKLNKKTGLEAVIAKLDKMLIDVQARNHAAFSSLKASVGGLGISSSKDLYEYNPEDILTDLRVKSDTLNKFKEYIIKKYIERSEANNKVYTSRVEEETDCNPDDIVCLVCNNGDYEDDDLIVYCSLCQMTVHQRCYGIIEIPQEDWICDTCLAFGLEGSKDVECVLCPVIGGAMKPCNIKKNSNFYCAIMNLRKKKKNRKFN